MRDVACNTCPSKRWHELCENEVQRLALYGACDTANRARLHESSALLSLTRFVRRNRPMGPLSQQRTRTARPLWRCSTSLWLIAGANRATRRSVPYAWLTQGGHYDEIPRISTALEFIRTISDSLPPFFRVSFGFSQGQLPCRRYGLYTDWLSLASHAQVIFWLCLPG